MSARRERVVLDGDASALTRGLLHLTRFGHTLFARFNRRATDTPGDRHIDRIARDCADRRLPVEDTARRLMVASDAAGVLDGRGWVA